MRIAVLGPVCRDVVSIDGIRSADQLGGIPYYVALTLRNLGVDEVVPYITYGKADRDWVLGYFDGMNVRSIPVERSLESTLEYTSADPDSRRHKISYSPNVIEPTTELLAELERYDHIILSPLFHDDIPYELFSKLRHKSLIHGNFGMFTYEEDGKFVRKHPENLIRILPFLTYLFLDDNEAKFVSGASGIDEAGALFLSHDLKISAITEGSRGSRIFSGKRKYDIPAFPPKALADPTGAGDTYMAAYIRSLELFETEQERGTFAAMVATMSLEKHGAFDGSLSEVMARLEAE
ncbi:MAG: carbohydrate kinase family protein [Candidatus Moranbacteria bacterium]|nr:carbohydrate kinase family protein [Candidatus Moranbacteria bacterium]